MRTSTRHLSVSTGQHHLRDVMRTQGAAHQHNWDRLRVFASLDIVGSHLGGEHLFGGVGTPLFLILAIAFGVQRPTAGDTGPFVQKRVRRVLLPWLVWSLAIATCLSLSHLQRSEPAFGWWKPEMLLYGPQIHLWFLPVAAAFGLIAHTLHRATSGAAPMAVAYTALALGLANLLLCPRGGHGWPFEQWSFSAPSLWIGFGLGRLLAGAEAGVRGRWKVVAALVVCVAGCLVLDVLLPGASACTRRYAGALALLAVAAAVPGPPDRLTPKLTTLMLGTYVLHPIVFQLLVEPVLWKLRLGHAVWARVGFGYVVTLALVALLRRTRLRAVL